jgi:beta-glucuronidase
MNKQRNPGNFEEAIHNEQYREEYYRKIIDVSSWTASRSRSEYLDGEWGYSVDQYDSFLRGRWFEERETDDEGNEIPRDIDLSSLPVMKLPISWNTADQQLFLYEGPMVFTRTFRFQLSGEEERAVIKFHGAQYETFLFVNGRYIGVHRGGSTGFCADITEAISSGSPRGHHRIVVVVDNTRRTHQLPALNTDWFNYGGIYRSVELIRLPACSIQRASVQLVPDGTYRRLRAEVQISREEAAEAVLEIPELGIRQAIALTGGQGSAEIEAEPQLWTPDTPKLYSCRFTCGEDELNEQIGFREIRSEGSALLLNGEQIFLRGMSVHEETIEGGKHVSSEKLESLFSTAKELGCNFLRLAHYPHGEEAARLADRAGLLLWEEIPVYWAIAFGNEATFEDASNQLRELIRRDYNRASVIFWSVGNENADTDERLSFMSRLVQTVREEDSTRLVSAACLVNKELNRIQDRLAEHLDVVGLNEYFGWYDPDFTKLPDLLKNSSPGKPVIITETGAGARAGHRGGRDEFFTEDKQVSVYEQQIEHIRRTPYICGMTPWILYDFRCPRRQNPLQRGYNLKGLVSADYTYRKPAFYVLQDFYRELAGSTGV